VANWRKTNTPNIYVAHQRRCAAFADASARCNCAPSWRGRRWNPYNRRSEWQKPVTKDRSEVLAWLGAGKKGASHLRERASAGHSFESIGDQWIAGVAAGRIGRRKGRGKPYTDSTIRDYERSYRHFLRPEFGPMPADDIGEHHDPRRGRLGDLRVGDCAEPPARDPESTPPGRAPTE
jgi:hypothetical protein